MRKLMLQAPVRLFVSVGLRLVRGDPFRVCGCGIRLPHAPSVPRGDARGATGTRVPARQPEGRYRTGPEGAGCAFLGTPSGSLRPCRVPRLPCGTRVQRFVSWDRALASRSARLPGPHDHTLSPRGRSTLPAITDGRHERSIPGLLDIGPPTRRPPFQAPVLATLGAGSKRPAAGKRPAIVGTA